MLLQSPSLLLALFSWTCIKPYELCKFIVCLFLPSTIGLCVVVACPTEPKVVVCAMEPNVVACPLIEPVVGPDLVILSMKISYSERRGTLALEVWRNWKSGGLWTWTNFYSQYMRFISWRWNISNIRYGLKTFKSSSQRVHLALIYWQHISEDFS